MTTPLVNMSEESVMKTVLRLVVCDDLFNSVCMLSCFFMELIKENSILEVSLVEYY